MIKNKGFTLVEMAIVMVIISIVMGVGFSTVGAYLDNAKQASTKNGLAMTKQVLLNYLKVNQFLPCPDTNGDGLEDRVGASSPTCGDYLGTVPYQDLGISRGSASDNYGYLFGYAVHQDAADSAVMGLPSDDTNLPNSPGAYFYNEDAPTFDMKTPPTSVNVGDSNNSYQVCSRDADDDCPDVDDVEMKYLPVVLIAYNENGGRTSLRSCTGSRGDREDVNCEINTDTEPMFIRGVFDEGVFDDQIETISAYEIKNYGIGDLGKFELTTTP